MIYVKKLKILNFKCFKEFKIDFNEHVNIIVGNNEEGKSTILEALHLALSGMMNGRTSFTDISESIFNKDAVNEYISSLTTAEKEEPPYILIEVYLGGEDAPKLQGTNNTDKEDISGLYYKILYNDQYKKEYESLLLQGEVKSIPVEYYKIERYSFAGDPITNRTVPLKSVVIDSSSHKYQNGSDIYISKIIRDNLEEKELTALTQSYRKLKESFRDDDTIAEINRKISQSAGISNRNVTISVDMSVKNSWDTVLTTCIDDVPFPQVGKGEQCVIKTNLALAHKTAQDSSLILIEEPENHLSHVKLNILLDSIDRKCSDKQLIITTHSNFVANKLGLDNLLFLSNQIVASFNELPSDDVGYFKKLPGYDTLRLILANGAILVEGPSDELIVQRAYFDKYNKLPIQDGIDVISVRGLSFKRFLEIAKRIHKRVAVVTDNDGDYQQKIEEKYKGYDDIEWIKICADTREHLKTLEPQFVDSNKDNLEELRKAIGIKADAYPDEKAVSDYMEKNKSDWALKIFDSENTFNYPDYIKSAVDWMDNGE